MISSPAKVRGMVSRRPKKTMKKVISLIAIVAICGPVMADNSVGFYGSTGGGFYRFKGDGLRDSAPTLKLSGGYAFNDKLSAEASYNRLFEASDTVEDVNVDIDGNLWDVSAKLSWPLGNRIAPYGRLGYSYADLKAVATEDGERIRASEYDTAFSWAAGATMKLTQRLGLNGEYARSMIDNADLELVSLSMTYRFGAF